MVKILNSLSESEFWDMIGFLTKAPSLSKKMTKFLEFLILSKLEQ